MKNKIMLAVLLPTLAACSYTNLQERDNIVIKKVANKAAFDFQCPKEKLTVSIVETGVYGVIGCGKRGTYVGINRYCDVGYLKSIVEEKCSIAADTLFKD